ncbi:MAG: hypothetical protein ACYTHM_10970 [Planctomycetota bacterium]|jgi:hypothetical protein
MNVRRRLPRLFAGLGVMLALAALGTFVVPAGCGGGGEGTSKKKKKKKKGSGKKKGDQGKGGGEVDETQVQIELIKDQFTGVYTEFYGGNATPAQLYKALLDAEKALEKYDESAWAGFNSMVKGRFYAHVDLAEWLLARKKAEAFSNLDDLEGGKKLLKEASDFLEVVDKSKIEKLKMGDNPVDYPQFYDDAKAKIADAFRELEVMAAIVKRKPPAGEINLLDQDENLWVKGGKVDMTLTGGEMLLEATGKGGRVTATHYYLKDFSLKITFTIQSGGFDILLRALPDKNSVFNAGFNKEELPDPNGPFTMVLEVQGNVTMFLDSEGRALCDPIDTDRAPKGGGIAIALRTADSSMMIREMILEAK